MTSLQSQTKHPAHEAGRRRIVVEPNDLFGDQPRQRRRELIRQVQWPRQRRQIKFGRGEKQRMIGRV